MFAAIVGKENRISLSLVLLTLTVLVTTIDALQYFETG